MALDVPPAAAPQVTPLITTAESTDFDQRWAAWQAKGAAHDRAFRRKIAIIAPTLIVAAAVIISVLLGR